MSLRENLRRGRTHLITAAVLLATGLIVIGVEDDKLAREVGSGQPAGPRQDQAAP
jgi:hypothetical protein